METMRLVPGLTPVQMALICDWTNEQGRDYLMQWAGREVSFPLMLDEVSQWQQVYAICLEDELVGMIQLIRREGETLHVGRFMIQPSRVGRGLGKRALSIFMEELFADPTVQAISLHVFTMNHVAKRLYETVGFQVVQAITSPVPYYRMVCKRK